MTVLARFARRDARCRMIASVDGLGEFRHETGRLMGFEFGLAKSSIGKMERHHDPEIPWPEIFRQGREKPQMNANAVHRQTPGVRGICGTDDRRR
ncbi:MULTISPECIES: hypothetical protein [Sphingobium]|nr:MULTISPECIES: hypothetical protein [Sphingobium]